MNFGNKIATILCQNIYEHYIQKVIIILGDHVMCQ